MCEHFWSRWSAEYLHELQQRPKWRASRPNVKMSDACLVRSDLLPPGKWPSATIIEFLPGPDNLVRVVFCPDGYLHLTSTDFQDKTSPVSRSTFATSWRRRAGCSRNYDGIDSDLHLHTHTTFTRYLYPPYKQARYEERQSPWVS